MQGYTNPGLIQEKPDTDKIKKVMEEAEVIYQRFLDLKKDYQPEFPQDREDEHLFI